MRIVKNFLFLNLIVFSFLLFCSLTVYAAAQPFDINKGVEAVIRSYQNFVKQNCLYIIAFVYVSFITVDYMFHGIITKFSIILASLVSCGILYFGFLY